MCDPRASQGDEKMQFLFLLLFDAKQKPCKIIFHAGRVTSLQSWVAEKSCHGQTLINECSIFDYPSNFEDL